MKKHILIFTFIVFTVLKHSAQEWTIVSELIKEPIQIKLEYKTFGNDFRVNPDSLKFPALKFRLYFKDQRGAKYYELEDVLYSRSEFNYVPANCILLDTLYKVLTIFILEKEVQFDYGMTGYSYRLVIDKGEITRETVFPHKNFGWFSFFGGSYRGNPILCHFAYDGYKAVESIRNNDGTWNTFFAGDIKPEIAGDQLKDHSVILISTDPFSDKMNGVTKPTYNRKSVIQHIENTNPGK